MRILPQFTVPFPKGRPDLIVVGAGALFVWLISTPVSAHFIQQDTSTQNYVALAMVRGCWEYLTEKMLAVFLLVPFYALFGPSPYWETLLLALAFSASVVAVYEIAQCIDKSTFTALAAIGLFMSLPAVQLFSHTYFGYLICCVLWGWYFSIRRRLGLAGFSFGCAIIAHFNALVPVGISVGLSLMLHFQAYKWKGWLLFFTTLLAPIVFTELVFLAYLGTIGQWTRGTLAVIWRLGGLTAAQASQNDWVWLPRVVIGSNGWFLSALLAIGIASPVVFVRRRVPPYLALCGLAIAAFYTVQAGIGSSLMASRNLVAAYGVWCICSAITFAHITRDVRFKQARTMIALTAMGGLALSILHTSLYTYKFTQTLHPIIEEWFSSAANARRPVRFQGTSSALGFFYAQVYGVETLVNDDRWITRKEPGQAVLIFLGDPPQFTAENYTVTRTSISNSVDQMYPVLNKEAAIPRYAELWWPTGKSDSVRPQTPPATLNQTYYYAGVGCLTPPPFNNGQSWFYQLMLGKLAGSFGWTQP